MSDAHTTTLSLEDHALILAKIRPYLKPYHGKTVVVKYGGNAMTEPILQKAFAEDIVLLKWMGIHPIVVHGGGPQIEHLLSRLGKKGEFIQGMRVTDAETMQVVEWVLGGEVQQNIVGLIQQAGGQAIGLTGRDGGMIRAKPLSPDLGQVGDIEHIDVHVLKTLQAHDFIPVVSPIGYGLNNERYNINADVVAAKIATALQSEKLLMLTNITGVLDKAGQLINKLTSTQIDILCQDGTISGGMIPKLSGALEAAKAGVKTVHILDGRIPHALLLALLGDRQFGTMIQA